MPKKKKVSCTHPSKKTRWEQKVAIRGLVDEHTFHRIECFLCLTAEKRYGLTLADFVGELYDDGWREIETSDSIGVACPACVKDPTGESS